jgi:hypothetical protein
VGGGGHYDPFAFGTRIDAHSDGLLLSCRWLVVESHAKEASLPKAGSFPAPDPPPCPRGGRGHKWFVFLIDHRDKDV